MSDARKRKSFWEPEQPHIKEWIANQKDLGRSIQLLAADAIQKYGHGDAIEAMVNMQTGGTPMPMAPVTPTPAPVETPQPAPVQQAADVLPPPVTQPVQTPAPQAAPPVNTQATAVPASQQLGTSALDDLFSTQSR